MENLNTGRVTIPTDVDMIEETKAVAKRFGADALRDCDGTEMPEELKHFPAKIYSTYYTTRKDNAWAMANPDEIQQIYIMTEFWTAFDAEALRIPLMKYLYKDQLKPNSRDDIKRWWEVVDRSTGEPLPTDAWDYEEETQEVVIHAPVPFHEYTVSFLAYIMWDPVHMYNYITNDWKGVEHQITFDVRQPKTQKHVIEKLKEWMKANPDTNVVRFTTFFHQFTLVFDDLAREKFVDWFGYSASVSPYILEQFEQEAGYRFRPEYIIDQGYHNNTNRIPSKQFKDFVAFQRREVRKLVRVLVDICHENGKEAMMFLGDHYIGTEPWTEGFEQTGLDAVVGSVGNGTTTRLIADIKGVKYREGRFLPYFFPDVFHEGGDPVKEAKVNWVTARRAILRKPLDRIGYGGYLKLALKFPDFMDYIESVCNEFRELYKNIGGQEPYSHFTVGVLNAWGQLRAWGTHMMHHAIYHKQTYSYLGVLESLSGMPFEVKFISFDDVLRDPDVLKQCSVLVNAGDAYTAPSGGAYWADPRIQDAVKAFVAAGGGLVGVGEPSACEREGRYFQLASVFGVDEEVGFTINTDKYNFDVHSHFITEQCAPLDAEAEQPTRFEQFRGQMYPRGDRKIDFGEGTPNVYALRGTEIISAAGGDVQMAVNSYGKGRAVYMAGLPYSFENSRMFYRAIFWAAGREQTLKCWYSDNYNVEVNYYPATGKYCVVNNTYEPQQTTVYDGNGAAQALALGANEILWFDFK